MSAVESGDLVLGVVRVMVYAGFVLLAGILMFWVLVWPSGSRHRQLVLLAIGGSILLLLASIADPVLRLLRDGDLASALPRVGGAAVIIRVAVLACLAGFLTDFLRRPIVGGRRLAAVAAVLLLTATMVVPADMGSGALEQVGLAVVSAAHLLGAAVWLGGLAALTSVLLAKEALDRLERLVPRFTRVAALSLLVLVVSGAAQALDVATNEALTNGSSYLVAALVKVLGLVLMTLLAAYGLWYAKDAAFRRLRTPEKAATNPTVRQLTIVLRVELVTGLALLVATSLLVMARLGG